MSNCEWCRSAKAALKRPKTGAKICKECFYEQFETEIHQTVVENKLFERGEKIAIGASGGKDSTVLAHVLSVLNKKYDYGVDLFLLSIDEGITGYRDDSLETVKRNEQQYGIPLRIVSYKDLYGWTMDEIVREIGRKNNCTFCGVFRRQALDRGAALMGADKIVTGHNADDIAETVLMNMLRGDISRLGRCVEITTGKGGPIPRCKPFKYTYQKEIVMYAYYKNLDYFSTECVYSPFAYRGNARDLIKDLEASRNQSIIDIIRSAEFFAVKEETKKQVLGRCKECGYLSSSSLCKACVQLSALNKGRAKRPLQLTPTGEDTVEAAAVTTATTTSSSTTPAAPVAEVPSAGGGGCGSCECKRSTQSQSTRPAAPTASRVCGAQSETSRCLRTTTEGEEETEEEGTIITDQAVSSS